MLVTPFPHPSRRVHGVASYALELARALRDQGADVEVWADRPGFGQCVEQREDGLRVLRTWRPGPLAGADLIRGLQRRRPALVHIQVEHFVFGGMVGFAALKAFMLAVRLAGIPLCLTLHHVPSGGLTSGTELRHSGIWLPRTAARALLSVSTRVLGRLANIVIVHDDVFGRRLIEEFDVGAPRIRVIHHGVPRPRVGVRSGPPTLLMFGYLKWYKGIDIALKGFRLIAREIPAARLVIAGGLPEGVGRAHPHRRYIDEVRRLADSIGGQVELLDYVGEGAIGRLYEDATVVLFPYRMLFGASGPLSLALGYRKPFIVSDVLAPLVPFWPFTAANTPEAWAAEMRRVLAMPDLSVVAEGILDPVSLGREWPRVAHATLEAYGAAAAAVPRAAFELP